MGERALLVRVRGTVDGVPDTLGLSLAVDDQVQRRVLDRGGEVQVYVVLIVLLHRVDSLGDVVGVAVVSGGGVGDDLRAAVEDDSSFLLGEHRHRHWKEGGGKLER